MAKRKPAGLHHYKHPNGTTYYSMLHPETGKRVSLGTDYATACKILHRMQAEHYRDNEQVIWERINGQGKTLKAFVPAYLKSLIPRKLSANTLKQRTHTINAILLPAFGDYKFSQITTKRIADLIQTFVDRGVLAQALVVRTVLIDVFKESIAAGWFEGTHNPAALTRAPRPEIKRARLTLDQFNAIYSHARPGIEQSTLALALITSHASAEDLAAMRWPVDGFLWIERTKTRERVKIPIGLTLDALGWSVGEVVERCRDGVESPYILHHARGYRGKVAGSQLSVKGLTKTVTSIIARANIDWQGLEPATLYELRSLAIRLYDAQGVDVQRLAAHRDAASTAIYRDSRGADWQELKI